MNNRWRIHGRVLGALALLVAGLDVLTWFHPSLGYVEGGILDGADIRWALIQISWWLVVVFGIASTVAMRAFSFVARAWLRYVIAYGTSMGAVCLSMPIIDKFY